MGCLFFHFHSRIYRIIINWSDDFHIVSIIVPTHQRLFWKLLNGTQCLKQLLLKSLPYLFFLKLNFCIFILNAVILIFFLVCLLWTFLWTEQQWKQRVFKHYLLYLPKFTLQFKKALLLNVWYFLWLQNLLKFWLELWKTRWWTSTVVQCIEDLTSKKVPKFSRLTSLIKLNSSQQCCSNTSQGVKNTKMFIQSEFFQ